MSSSTIAIIITFITMILFFSNKFAMSVVSCAAALAMGILIPEMKLSQIYSGFGGSTVVMVAGMCIRRWCPVPDRCCPEAWRKDCGDSTGKK